MAISPLERDTTLKAEQQNSYSSSTLSPIHSITTHLRPSIIIHRGPRSFGFTLRAVKVFHGNTDYYTTQHVVVAVQGPAEEAGLRPNDVITHVNDHSVVGLIHSEVVKLILSGSQKLSIRAIPCSETQIRTGGRRRSPSKQKIRYQQTLEKKSSIHNESHSHQPYCQKHRMNSLGNNTLNTSGNNSNKKYQHNTSLFRRLSERKVARDIEAAAAAGVSLTIPTTSVNTNDDNNNTMKKTKTTTTTNTNTNILSSSLPLLSFNQSTLDPSEWPPLNSPTLSTSESDSLQPTLLPSIVKQKSQVSI
jgi:microtubule-associated serine/threonine kinase